MLKLLNRIFFSVFVLLLALVAPSALAARASHAARSRARDHGVTHRRKASGKARHKRRARLLGAQTTADVSSAVLVGESIVESHLDYVSAGQAEAFLVQSNATDIAGLAHVYIDSRNAARTLIVGLYSNAGGHPGLLLSTGSISTIQLGAWNSVSLAPIALVGGNTYWLALLGEHGMLRYRDREKGPCPSETSAQTSLGALSASWKTGRIYPTCPASAYVTAIAPVFGSPAPVELPPVESSPVVSPPVESPPVESPVVEPAPAAPTNTVVPAISGTTTEGHTLSATSGTWSGSPTSYKYQWQDCNASGEACSNVSGASASTFKLAAGDVGHIVRVLVTASNAGGATQATSASVGPVGAIPPIAAFTVTPVSSVAGQALTLDGSSSSCHAGPCSYAWSDDGSTTRPTPALWPLGSGQTLEYTFSGAGTKYVRLVVTDATGQTATIEHNVVIEATEPPPPPPPPPTAPANTVVPSVSGSAQVGQVLTVGNGAWEGSTPMSYAYHWQDCNASGEACSTVNGATSASYTATEGDVGHALRAIVTATNSAGSASASSAATAAVTAPVSAKCTTTDTAGMSASALASSLVSAADGSTVCLAGGSYPLIHVVGAAHKAYVTVRPAPGATVTVDGMEVANSSFLRFEGLRMTEGFNMRDSSSGASHDYEFVEDRFEEPLYGIVLYGGSSPVKKVLIEGNYMRRVHLEKPEVEGKCSAGYAQGQDVTMYYAEGVRIAHNTFKEAAWHYIQGGSEGPEGVDVEHNLFEGHILMNCSHLNIWQIWGGGENDTFKDNIALGENGQQAATDGVIFENGAGSVECNVKMKNSVIENNLFVNAATSYELQIYTTEGATIKNNTVVGSEYGTALLTEHCGAGSNYTMTHNIDVEDKGTGNDFNFGACTGTCTFDYNVSQDKSASSAHSVTEWAPKWTATVWSPATEPSRPTGFYVPTGLSVEAGYQGNIGP
jgi:hypothetical protein